MTPKWTNMLHFIQVLWGCFLKRMSKWSPWNYFWVSSLVIISFVMSYKCMNQYSKTQIFLWYCNLKPWPWPTNDLEIQLTFTFKKDLCTLIWKTNISQKLDSLGYLSPPKNGILHKHSCHNVLVIPLVNCWLHDKPIGGVT